MYQYKTLTLWVIAGLIFRSTAEEPVRAACLAGTVMVPAADHRIFTNSAVYIDHGDGLVRMYFHMNSLAVKTGALVERS
jgi:murein DD-endopeptidase MepM/ murein hydrolase activator NlpD